MNGIINNLRGFFKDEGGASDMVFKLVLAITIAAAVLVLMLQLLHNVQDSGMTAVNATGEGLKTFAENVSREISG